MTRLPGWPTDDDPASSNAAHARTVLQHWPAEYRPRASEGQTAAAHLYRQLPDATCL